MTEHVPRPVGRSDLARRKHVSPAAVTLAARPGGPLAAACLVGGRIDAAHPACIRWLGEHAYAEGEWMGSAAAEPRPIPATAIPIADFATLAGVTIEQLERDIMSSPA